MQQKADGGLQWFNYRVYQRLLKVTVAYRYAAVLLFIALFVMVVSLPLTGAVRVSFFPSMQDDTVSANMSLYSDASYGQNERNLMLLEKNALEADRQLTQENGADKSGISSLQVTASGDQSGTITISLDEDSSYSLDELSARWNALTGNLEGVKSLKIRSRREMVDGFNVEIKSINDDTLTVANDAFIEVLNNIDGVYAVESSLTPGEAMMRFELTPRRTSVGVEYAKPIAATVKSIWWRNCSALFAR